MKENVTINPEISKAHKRSAKRLKLTKDTVRVLSNNELENVHGGLDLTEDPERKKTCLSSSCVA